MAEVATAPDEDEKYLYGENQNSNTDAVSTKEGAASAEAAASVPTTAAAGSTEDAKKQDEEDEDGEFEESDDDDDDNIQVHIGEVNASTTGPYGATVNWKKDGAVATAVAKAAALPTQGPKKIDVNAVGLINGQPIYEYDIDTEQDEKPWRKPGADISDYFNYGFTEDTWKQYCEKQRRMRMESQRGPYTVTQAVNPANAAQVEIEVLPDGRTRVKAGPPPDRKVEGSIHVLGSNDARRKQKEEELLALALGSTRVLGPPGFPGQRPIYTALPGGAVMFNQMPGQPMPGQMMPPPPTSQQTDIGQPPSSANNSETSQASSQPQPAQQIQSLGGGPIMTTVGLPNGLQYMNPGAPNIPGLQQIIPGPGQMFPPGGGMGMEFPPQEPFMHPGAMLPPMQGGYGQFQQSDSDFDSDGENRRHRRRESKHRRHRDRSDRDRGERDKDRDRDRSVRRDRDRSDARRTRDHSIKPSDRKSKSHSSRSSSSVRPPEEESERKPRISRRSKKEPSDALTITSEEEPVKKEPPEVKQEPTGD